MEKYQEILQPVKQVVHDLGEKVLNWVLPSDAINGLIQGESAKRTAEMFTQDRLFEE